MSKDHTKETSFYHSLHTHMETSQLFTLSMRDFAKSLVVAVITAFLTSILAMVQSGAIPSIDNLQQAAMAAVTAGISYLIKNFLTNSQ